MPKCVECGAESPREAMFGASDDLRCGKCAGRRRELIASLPRRRDADDPPVWTFAVTVMAIMVYAGEQMPGSRHVAWLWNEPTRVWDGELWRLLTTVLPHGNLIHLAFNCYWTAVLGLATERAIGNWKFAGLLLLTAVGGSATQFLVSPGPTVGLSGVAYGLFGYLFAIRLYKDYARVIMTDSVMKMFLGWFFLCWLLTYAAGWHVANFAHAGGFAVGWLIGKAILKRKTELRIAGIAAAVFALAALTMYMPWSSDFNRYREDKALFQAPRDRAASEIDDVQIP